MTDVTEPSKKIEHRRQGFCILNIEDFNSCLNYIQAIPAKKDTLDYLLPVINTAVGIFLGIGLNHYRDHSKEKKLTENKLLCIKEEIQRIHSSLEHVFSECVSIHQELIDKENIIGHRLPNRIDSFFIDENFISVAHKYTMQERNSISNLMSLLAKQNEHLSSMNELFDLKQVEYWKNKVLNTLNNARFCIRKCRSLINNEEEKELPICTLADELKITSTLVEYSRNHINSKSGAT